MGSAYNTVNYARDVEQRDPEGEVELIYSIMTQISELCLACSRWWDVGPLRCDAFPLGIPDEILDGDFDHKLPHEGDGGKQFKQGG